MYNRRRKEILGEYLSSFRKNPELWPEDLIKWYGEREKAMSPMQRSRGLTIELLLEYMSLRTGLELNKTSYKNLLGNWSRWHKEPGRGGDNTALMLALATCRIVAIDDYVFTSLEDLLRWLLAED